MRRGSLLVSVLLVVPGTACRPVPHDPTVRDAPRYAPGESTGGGYRAAAGDRVAPPQGSVRVRVVRVVDGDTFVVRVRGRPVPVRLIGVDAPELGPATRRDATGDTSRSRPGRAARHALWRLAPPGSVLLVAADREPRDRYHRSLRYAWTVRGLFVNAALIRDGHARAMIIPPNDRFAEALRAAEAAAGRAPGGRFGGRPSGCA